MISFRVFAIVGIAIASEAIVSHSEAALFRPDPASFLVPNGGSDGNPIQLDMTQEVLTSLDE